MKRSSRLCCLEPVLRVLLAAGWVSWVAGCGPPQQTVEGRLRIQVLPSGVPTVGSNRLALQVTNPGRQPCSLAAVVELAGPSGRQLRREQAVRVGPGETRRWDLAYRLDEIGPHAGSLRVYGPGRRLVYALSDLRLVARPGWEFTPDRSYYTNEPFLRFRSRLHRGGGPSSQLVVELRDPSGVRARQVLAGRQEEVEGRLPIGSLPPGIYSLRARVQGAAGVEDSVALEVTKHPAGLREVKIDRFSQGLLVDGKPFFPVGLYWVRSEMLAEARRLHFNCGDYYYKLRGELIAELMAEAQRVGVGVLVELTEWVRGREEPDWQAIEQVVVRYRRHPALLVWYLVDEPADHKVRPAQARQVYERVRNLDPYHPVYLVNNRPATYAQYLGATDILAVDVYPVPDSPVTRVRDCVQQASWASAGVKPVWLVAQAFGGVEHWGRAPTPREFRNMVYQGLVHGARGVLFYRYCQADERRIQPPELWREMQAVAAELADLSPVLLAPDRPGGLDPLEDSPGVAAMLRKHDEKYYLFLVNGRPQPQRARMRLEGLAPLARVQSLYGAPSPRMQDGVLSAQLPPLGTAVYRLEPAAL